LKVISWLVSLGCSLFADPTSLFYSKVNTQHFSWNRGGVWKKWLSAYKSSNICETGQDGAKVTLEDQ